ncbi:MAG: protein-L-isoaspartate(D-aspartate) O-methyltransferase [Proteobacteria bacterium]|nr:protein-L-isoaspartate(D-aspartate) O-methyltransferase [Pseudomonadota bacterium]MBU6426290.1 protein-L-isoaspartate(D-aspartate) O-methyltransferase [Rhodospirillales bacterium]
MADLNALAIQRDNMVDSQVRPNYVNDVRITSAMRVLPREAFAAAGPLAYADADLPLGGGRFMLKPMVVARLAQLALEVNPAHILVVGAGSGYLAALLGLAGIEVVALEEEARLASPALAACAPKVQAVTGRLDAGWPSGSPYDVIIIEGAVPEIPAALAAQLSPGGRVVAILADDASPDALGRAVVAEPVAGGWSTIRVFDCVAHTLPQFALAPAFSF